jgi:hypothetical protein
MALSLTWGGRADTDIQFSEFFAGNHTVSVRFMLQFINGYAGPMLVVHGRGVYVLGSDSVKRTVHLGDKTLQHLVNLISIRIGNSALDVPIPTNFQGTWHHLAVVRNGATFTVYLDGASKGSLAASSSGNPSGALRLGRSDEIHQQFYGFLDDVAVFTAALPASRVAALAGATTLTGAEKNLLAGFVFGDGPRALPAKLKRPVTCVPGARNVTVSNNRNSAADRELLPLSLVSHMRLPFRQGKIARVMQGFGGTLSHHRYAVFAYDLEFPDHPTAGDEYIRASAPGVVAHVQDGTPDDQSTPPNYVTIEQAPGEFCDHEHIRFNGFEVGSGQAVTYGTVLAKVGMVHQALTNLGKRMGDSDFAHFVTIPLPYCNYEVSDDEGLTWHHVIRDYLKEGQWVRNGEPRSPVRYAAAWTPGTTGESQIYDVPYARFRARYDELWPQGWRLHSLSIVVVQGTPLYTAVWRPGTGGEIQIYGATFAEYKARYDELWPQGWRLKLLTQYWDGLQIRYTAAWAPGTGGEIQIYDVPYAQYRARYDELWAQGWRLKLIDVVERFGVPAYTAVWEPSTVAEAQIDVATIEQFRQRYDELWPDGWRLRHLSAYHSGGPRITAVWRQTNEPEIWVHGWEYADVRARYDVLWEQGWRLKVLDRYAV